MTPGSYIKIRGHIFEQVRNLYGDGPTIQYFNNFYDAEKILQSQTAIKDQTLKLK